MIPINALLLSIAAGIISAIVFASATTGPVILRVVLFLLTPLSLYLAGLNLGTMAAIIAGIGATFGVLALSNPLAAEVYAVSTALPAVVITRLALLSRDDETGFRHWYPVGRIVAVAAAFSALFSVIALVLMGGDIDALTKMMRNVVESFVKSDLGEIPGAPKIDDSQIDALTTSTLYSLPWALGLLSMSTILLNLWLAGRVTLASGRLLRPWPDLSAIQLPASATISMAAAIALSFIGGTAGLFAIAIAAPFVFAFALVGLALVHAFTRGSPWRGFALTILYVGLIFVPHIGLLLAVVGIAETIFHYRSTIENRPSNDGA